MTQLELLQKAREGNPAVRYAASKDGLAIGAWVEAWGRFAVVAGLAITGEWVSLPYELLLDGKPPYGPEDWVE
jgi:hypothetical protein